MALVIDIKVIPQSGRQEFKIDKNGKLKCFLKSPPEGGRANAELCKLLAKKLRIPVDDVSILLGAAARKKRIKIECEMSENEFLVALGVERQLMI